MRLISLKIGFSPDHSLGEIAETIGRSIQAVQRWFDQYRQEELTAIAMMESSITWPKAWRRTAGIL